MKSIAVRQITNGFIVTVQGGAPVANGSNEKFVASLEELTALLAATFAPAS